MKRYSIVGKAAEYALLVPLGFACAYSLLTPFVPAQTMKDNILPIFFCCAAVILLDLLFQKAVRVLAFVIAAAAAALCLSQIFLGDVFGSLASAAFRTTGESLVRSSGFASAGLCAFAAFVSLLTAYCGRRRLRTAVFWGGTTVILSYLAYTGHGENLPALLVITGCCALLFYRAGAEAGPEGNAQGSGPLFRATAAALVVVAAALAVTQLGFTGLKAVFGSSQKINIADFTARMQSALFSTSGFGDYNPNRLLGLRITMNDTLVLEVRADGPFYLRGRIYDTYTGKSWRAAESSDENDVYHQNLSPALPGYGNLRQFDLQGFRSGSAVYSFPKRSGLPLRARQISVTTKTEGQKYLFLPAEAAGGLTDVLEGKLALQHTYPDLQTARPLALGTEYSVTYLQPDWDDPAFEAVTPANRRRIGGGIQAAFGSTAGLTDRTVALAKSITKDASNEFQKAEAIKKWLTENCTYTLSPPQPWSGQDFVDYFLFNSKKGYCEHFATAMAMLLRASGVPARFIEGYASPSVSEAGLYEVTNAQAHAWVEYYSSLYGFITADPSPASALPRTLTRAEMRETPSAGASSASAGEAPSPSSAPASSAAPSSAPSSLSPRSPAASSPGVPAGGAAGAAGSVDFAIAALAVLLAVLPYAGKTAYRALWFAVIRRKSGRKLTLALYGYFASVLAKLGFPVSPSSTPRELADRVRGSMRFGAVGFDRVTQIALEVRFGEREPTAGERNELISFYRALPAACRKKLGTWKYLLRYPILH